MSKLELNDVDIFYGDFHAVQNVNMHIPAQAVTAFIGPSGCGKSTVIRSINRMHEVIPGAHVKGEILLDGENIYDPKVNYSICSQDHRHGVPEGQPIPNHVY